VRCVASGTAAGADDEGDADVDVDEGASEEGARCDVVVVGALGVGVFRRPIVVCT
jgi:hypothetical protein